MIFVLENKKTQKNIFFLILKKKQIFFNLKKNKQILLKKTKKSQMIDFHSLFKRLLV